MLVVALDTADRSQARAWAEQLSPLGVGFKVGLELFSAWGPRAVEDIAPYGPVFLDLKLHDIPATVAAACRAVAKLGARWVTAHALGGIPMLGAAVQALAEAAPPGMPSPQVLAVTVLTSHDAHELSPLGLPPPQELAGRLAAWAAQAGCAGVVASAWEVSGLRAILGPQAVVATPGIRPAGAQAQDQRRTATPAQAVAWGANLVVVGRPITRAADPVASALAILHEMEEAMPT